MENARQMVSLRLTDRSLVEISGPDAELLLQGILTTDLATLAPAKARAGALLTPQGKILFDFLISRSGDDGFRLETDRANAAGLSKRLMLYKLRAKADISTVDDAPVVVSWGGATEGGLRDTRFRAGVSVHRSYDGRRENTDEAAGDDYDRLRIASAVAESGHDFALSDAFPHDVLMDLNDGVSFRKGCFVGQEVVSRMQHRKSARKRIAIVEGEASLPASGTSIEAGGRGIGTVGTVVGNLALGLVRTDRVADALAQGASIAAGGVRVRLSFPDWTGLAFEPAAAAEHG